MTTPYRWTPEREAEAAEVVVKVADAQYRLAEATRHRDDAVRQALAEGVPVDLVATVYRLTRTQVRQLRQEQQR